MSAGGRPRTSRRPRGVRSRPRSRTRSWRCPASTSAPGAAKTHLSDSLVVCVLIDVFTPFEKTLIEAGQEDRVRETGALHRAATEDVYKGRMEAVLGRRVGAHMNTIHVDPDVAVDIFVLGEPAEAGPGLL